MSFEQLVERLREMELFYGRLVVDGKFVAEPTRTGKLFTEAIAAIAGLREELSNVSDVNEHLGTLNMELRSEVERLNRAADFWKEQATNNLATVEKLERENVELRLRAKDADALADAVEGMIRNRLIDARSPAGDSLLDYRDGAEQLKKLGGASE
jgi:hypothetical protein